MNNLFYVIDKTTGEIQASGLDVVYTLHLFLQGLPFEKLEIKPSTGSETINIPTTGGFDTDTPRFHRWKPKKSLILTLTKKYIPYFFFRMKGGKCFDD